MLDWHVAGPDGTALGDVLVEQAHAPAVVGLGIVAVLGEGVLQQAIRVLPLGQEGAGLVAGKCQHTH